MVWARTILNSQHCLWMAQKSITTSCVMLVESTIVLTCFLTLTLKGPYLIGPGKLGGDPGGDSSLPLVAEGTSRGIRGTKHVRFFFGRTFSSLQQVLGGTSPSVCGGLILSATGGYVLRGRLRDLLETKETEGGDVAATSLRDAAWRCLTPLERTRVTERVLASLILPGELVCHPRLGTSALASPWWERKAIFFGLPIRPSCPRLISRGQSPGGRLRQWG